MIENKESWTPQQVLEYLQSLPINQKRILPSYAYVTENFTWNEVLRTNARNIDIPTKEILENLKYSADVLQKYRTQIGKPITITSSWRTPSDIIRIRKESLRNNSAPPSDTSLHLEGLALDFVVNGVNPLIVYDDFNKTFLGELEKDSFYTHIGLPTYSEKYLKRNGIYSDKIYRKLSLEGITLTQKEREKVIKRITASNWLPLPSKFDEQANIQKYKHFSHNNKTPSQKFDDELRAQYKIMKENRNKKYSWLFPLSKANTVKSIDLGHWVTINGKPVYIDCSNPSCPNW